MSTTRLSRPVKWIRSRPRGEAAGHIGGISEARRRRQLSTAPSCHRGWVHAGPRCRESTGRVGRALGARTHECLGLRLASRWSIVRIRARETVSRRLRTTRGGRGCVLRLDFHLRLVLGSTLWPRGVWLCKIHRGGSVWRGSFKQPKLSPWVVAETAWKLPIALSLARYRLSVWTRSSGTRSNGTRSSGTGSVWCRSYKQRWFSPRIVAESL